MVRLPDFLGRKVALTFSIDFISALISRSLRSLISRNRCFNRRLRAAGESLGSFWSGGLCFMRNVCDPGGMLTVILTLRLFRQSLHLVYQP